MTNIATYVVFVWLSIGTMLWAYGVLWSFVNIPNWLSRMTFWRWVNSLAVIPCWPYFFYLDVRSLVHGANR